jgi:hypothetical protein
MSLNARMTSNDPRLYHADRDVAHNFKSVMKHVFVRLRDRRCPELEDLLVKAGVPDEEVDKAFNCLVEFVSGAYDNGSVEYMTLLEDTGWFKCHPQAQMAVWATLGMVTMGYHFAGVREVTLGGEGPAKDIKSLAAELISEPHRFAAFLALPRWQRKLRLQWERLKQRFRRKRETT